MSLHTRALGVTSIEARAHKCICVCACVYDVTDADAFRLCAVRLFPQQYVFWGIYIAVLSVVFAIYLGSKKVPWAEQQHAQHSIALPPFE